MAAGSTAAPMVDGDMIPYRVGNVFIPLLADNFMDSGGDGRCEACGQVLTDSPKEMVHVDWGTPVERYPTVQRAATTACGPTTKGY